MSRFAALYKGLVPKIMRLGPGGAIMLLVYENVYEYLVRRFPDWTDNIVILINWYKETNKIKTLQSSDKPTLEKGCPFHSRVQM